jgi:hypothetical protein
LLFPSPVVEDKARRDVKNLCVARNLTGKTALRRSEKNFAHGHGGRRCLLMTWLKIVRKDLSRHSWRWFATAGPTS